MDIASSEPINMHSERMRFLCEHSDGTYKLYMGSNMFREFTDEDLPAEIKTAIGMINSVDWDRLHSTEFGSNSTAYESLASTVLWTQYEYFPEISKHYGWRIKNRYALIVPEELFMKLRGSPDTVRRAT